MPTSTPDDVPTLTDLASLDPESADELAITSEIPVPDETAEAATEGEGDETIRGAIPDELRSSGPEEVLLSSPVLVHPKSLMPSSIAPVALDLSGEPHPADEDTETLRTEVPRPAELRRPTTDAPVLIDTPRAIPRGRVPTGTARDPLLAIVPHATSHVRAYAIAASLAAAAALAVGAVALVVHGPTGSAAGAGAAPRVADVIAAHTVTIDGPVAEKMTAEPVHAAPTGTLRFPPSTKGALVDGHPTRIPDGGALVLACGRHTIKVGGNPHVTVDVPCGASRTF